MSGFAAVLRKDLRLELRSGESTLALLALSMLVLVVLVFALDAARVRSVDAAAGALWVAMVFAGMLGANRALLAERDNGAIRGLLLSPLDPATLYAAKLAAALIFMAVAEVGAVILMVLFFNLDFDASTVRLAPILAAGRDRILRARDAALRNHGTHPRRRHAVADSGRADFRARADCRSESERRRAGGRAVSPRWAIG